jgi:hypothetical protein
VSAYLTVAKLKEMAATHESVVSIHLSPEALYDLEGDATIRTEGDDAPGSGVFDVVFQDIGPLIGVPGLRLFCSSGLPSTEVRLVDSAGNVHPYTVATSYQEKQ